MKNLGKGNGGISLILISTICILFAAGCAGSVGGNLPPGVGQDAAPVAPDSGVLPDASPPRQDGQAAPDSGAALFRRGAVCGSGAQCQSGHCVDGYCCDRACSGVCQVCDVKGAEGLCTPSPRGKDPDNDCPGQQGCGDDVCDGLGACMAPKGKGVLCKAGCSSSDMLYLTEQFCDGAGKCAGAARTQLCAPYTCQPATAGGFDMCGLGCKTHAECASGSACDRSAAHKTGLGECVDPVKVQEVKDDAELKKALLDLEKGTSTRTHLLLTGKTYSGWYLVNGTKVTVMGYGPTMTAFTHGGGMPPLSVVYGGELTLQGIKISGAKGIGLYCDDLVVAPRLTVLESVVDGSGNVGVFAGGRCQVELRRSWFTNNKVGGLRLLGGGVAVNNVVTGNGSATSTAGGAYLVGDAKGSFTFSNNTVSDNMAQNLDWSGLRCRQVYGTLKNNVVWNANTSKSLAITSGCAFSHSLVQGLKTGAGCINSAPVLDAVYKPGAKSPCIDAGAATSTTTIDISGKPRPGKTGGKVDLGAFEVK